MQVYRRRMFQLWQESSHIQSMPQQGEDKQKYRQAWETSEATKGSYSDHRGLNLSSRDASTIAPFVVSVQVDEKYLKMEVDTGASVSLISEDMVEPLEEWYS